MEFGHPTAPSHPGNDDHTVVGAEEHHEKVPMMTKMKNRMRKIKDSMTKGHGHGDDHVDDHVSDNSAERGSEGFDDAEDEDMDVDEEVHVAPNKVPSLISAFESATNAPQQTARDVSPDTEPTGRHPYDSVPATKTPTIPHTTSPVSPRRSDLTDTSPITADGIPSGHGPTDTSAFNFDSEPTPTVNLRGHKSPATSPVDTNSQHTAPVGIPRGDESSDVSPAPFGIPTPVPVVTPRDSEPSDTSSAAFDIPAPAPVVIPRDNEPSDTSSAAFDIPTPAPVVIPRDNEPSDTSSAPFDTPYPAPVLVPRGNDSDDTSPINLDTVEETNPHTEPAAPDSSTHTTNADNESYPTSYGPPGGSEKMDSPELLSSFQAMAISEQREGQQADRQPSGELPEAHVAADVEKKPATYTEMVTSTAVAAKDAAVSVASTVYSKVTGSPRGTASSPTGTVSSPRSPMTTPGYGLEEKKPSYTEKLSGTAWAAKDAAVSAASTMYAKVAGSPTVDSSVTHDDVARESTPSAQTGSPTKQEKGASVREYLSEKLSPGEDEKALCEVISGSMKKRGSGEDEEVVEKGRIELPEATGGEKNEQFDSQDDTNGLGAGTGAGGEKGMLEKIKGAVGPLVGTGGDKKSDSAGAAGAGAGAKGSEEMDY